MPDQFSRCRSKKNGTRHWVNQPGLHRRRPGSASRCRIAGSFQPMCRARGAEAGEMADTVNILLVDDQPSNLLALEAILADLGQNLVKAHSGAAALKCLLE